MKFALDNGEESVSSSSFLSNKVKARLSNTVTKDISKHSCCPSLTLK